VVAWSSIGCKDLGTLRGLIVEFLVAVSRWYGYDGARIRFSSHGIQIHTLGVWVETIWLTAVGCLWQVIASIKT
jgi:hypothetical protein